MFEQYNLTSLDTESLDNDKIRRYTTEMRVMREKYLYTDEAKSVRNPVRSANWSTEQFHCSRLLTNDKQKTKGGKGEM